MNSTQAEMLRTAIREAGYTLKRFAEAVGMGYLQLYKRLNGDIDFTLSEVKTIADTLRMSNETALRIFFCR